MTWCLRRSWWVMVLVAAACASPRSQVRYGSLVAGSRSLDYDPQIAWWKLANQLTVAVIPDPRANLVSVDVRYLVGAAEDPPGKTGLAHLVEHMMLEKQLSPGGPTISDQLAAVGLSYDASTYWDSTHYVDIGLASRLDELLAIEATRMASGCAGLDEAALQRARSVVHQELAQREPANVREALLAATFGPGHAYSHSVGGTDVAALTLDDVCRFIDAHYAPDRAILVISGRIAGAARDGIKTRFGAITRRAKGAPATVQPIAWTGATSELPGVDDPSVLVLFPAAPWGSKEWIYDNLVDRVIVHQLEQVARHERWILRVSTRQLGGYRGGARGFELRLTDAARADDAVAEVYATIRDLEDRYYENAVIPAVAARRSELLAILESVEARGHLYASYLQFTTDGRFHLRELVELGHVSYKFLRERADRLRPDASRVIRLIPAGDHARAGQAELAANARIDVPGRRPAVDPSEATRPIALPHEPRTSALREQRLPNGLRVVMLSGFKQPVFDARLVFPVGVAAGDRKLGVASAAAAALSFDYNTALTQDERNIQRWVYRLGAQTSWHVSDHTAFRISGFSLFADWHLWQLQWLLANGTYSQKEVSNLQDVLARNAAHRDRLWGRALREALFGRDHPLAEGDAAVASTIGSLPVPDLEQFRATYYRAHGATLILVGNFDPDAMMKHVTELFGAWPSEPAPAISPLPPMHPAAGPTWIAAADPEVVRVRASYGFAATSPRTSRAARLVVAEIVRDRVAQVRARLGASDELSAGYNLSGAGDTLEVSGLVDAAHAGEAVRALEADLEALRSGDAALAADFVRARRRALTNALADPLRSGTAADQLEAVIANRLPIDAIEMLPAEIAAATLDDARAVIAQDLQPARMAVVLSGRPEDTAAAFAAAGITEFQTVGEPATPIHR